MLCQVCLVKYATRTCFGEICKEDMFCQVCLGKWTCFVIFVKYAWWSAVLQNQAKREHVLSSMPGEMPFCQNKPKENMLCQVCLGKCRIPKTSSKRTCFVIFVTYAWWSAVLQKKTKENMLCQVCLVKCRFSCKKNTSWKRTSFVIFVKYAWRNAVVQKQTEREHALSSLPGEMPYSKNKFKENMFCHLCHICLVKCRFAKTN